MSCKTNRARHSNVCRIRSSISKSKPRTRCARAHCFGGVSAKNRGIDTMRTKEEFIDFLFELCAATGVTGAESDAATLALRELRKYMPAKIDTMGNVIGESEEDGLGILLDAHIDTIGMVVTAVDDEGFVKFARCGAVDTRPLAANEVIIHGKEPIYGVITSTPPHLSKGTAKVKECEDMSIDTGIPGEQLRKIVTLGNRISLCVKQRRLLNGRISSPALDDRAGVAAILRCLELLDGKYHGCKLTVLFSVQEETSGSGATTGAYVSDATQAIAVDVSFARAPDVSPEKSAALGGGTMIGIAPALNEEMSKTLLSIAEKNDIPHCVEVMGGGTGTNADAFQKSRAGKKAGLLSIPQRNMHTGVEVCDIEDIENTARLLAQYIANVGGKGHNNDRTS